MEEAVKSREKTEGPLKDGIWSLSDRRVWRRRADGPAACSRLHTKDGQGSLDTTANSLAWVSRWISLILPVQLRSQVL